MLTILMYSVFRIDNAYCIDPTCSSSSPPNLFNSRSRTLTFPNQGFKTLFNPWSRPF